MPYDKESINQVDKEGMFDSNMDAKILGLDDSEKAKMSGEFEKIQKDMTPSPETTESKERRRKKKDMSLDIELTLFERIILFFLTFLGISTVEQFKIKKIIKYVEKDIAKIKPPIYNTSQRRISKYFAFKIHDLYLKLIWLKKIFEKTLDNKKFWDNPKASKTVVERLFEKLANMNTEEIDDKFSQKGLETIVTQFPEHRKAMETIEKSLYAYVYAIDKSAINRVNEIYTNLLYFKNLTEFDFFSLFKRFDPTFHPGVSPNFTDIPGEGILPYLRQLEEAILQIDLAMDNIFIFKKLHEIAAEFEVRAGSASASSSGEEMEAISDIVSPEKLENELIVLFEILKELLYKKYLTLLVQIIKSDPLYSPSFVHTKYDLFKIYLETFEKRIKTVAKSIIQNKKKKEIETASKKLYQTLLFVGIYNTEMGDELETSGYAGFYYTYHCAIINSFIEKYYKEYIKNAINLLLLNGLFSEKNFHKMVSETFYNMDKFIEKFDVFNEELKPEGTSAKRLTKMISRKDRSSDRKKVIEQIVVSINGHAKDFYEEFSKIFSMILNIITKVYDDLNQKPPKYIRNIRGIAGFRNTQFIQSIEKSEEIIKNMQDIIDLLKG